MVIQDNWKFKRLCRGNLSDITFLEWKYFSFSSEEIEGFFCYSVGDPNNKFGLKKCILTYAIYFKDDERIGYFEPKKKTCSLEDERKWNFGNSFIEKIDARSWRIKGKTGEIEIDLKYKNVAEGGEIRTNLGRSIFGRSWMDWIVFCNSAEVNGLIKSNDKVYQFEGLGYYDSNIGYWKPSENLWTWGHGIKKIDDTIISFSIAETRGEKIKNGKMYLSIDKDTKTFSFDEYILTYDTNKKIPKKYTIKAESDDYHVKIFFKADKTNMLRIKGFKIVPLIDLLMKRGRTQVKIEHPERGEYNYECKGAWEFPKRPSIL